MNRKVIISTLVLIMLVVVALAVLYGHGLYQMFLRAHGMG